MKPLTAADFGKIRHDVADGDGSVGSGLGPLAVGEVPLIVDLNTKGGLGEAVQWLGVHGQADPGGGGEQDAPAPRLCHPEVAGLQDPERALVSHLDQGPDGQDQDHALLERREVAHVLQDEELRTVVVAIRQVG